MKAAKFIPRAKQGYATNRAESEKEYALKMYQGWSIIMNGGVRRGALSDPNAGRPSATYWE